MDKKANGAGYGSQTPSKETSGFNYNAKYQGLLGFNYKHPMPHRNSKHVDQNFLARPPASHYFVASESRRTDRLRGRKDRGYSRNFVTE